MNKPELRNRGGPSAKPGKPSRFNGPLVALSVIALVIVGFFAARQYFSPSATTNAAAQQADQLSIGGPFTLVDQDGKTVTDQDFRGQWLLIYFGFTYCPDVCPTSLNRNSEALDLLGARGDKVLPILISVDPQRDTPEKLKDYVHFFHPRTVGLSGTPEQIATVAREYRVFYVKVPRQDPNEYLIDHSSFTYLVDPNGQFVQFFRHEATAQEVAERLGKLL